MDCCRIHPDRPAAGRCRDCGEAYCENCLEAGGSCRACGEASSRFFEGFSLAISRWEAGLRSSRPAVGTAPAPPRRRALVLARRGFVVVLGLLVAWMAVEALSDFDRYRATLFISQGNLDRALELMEQAARKNPDDAGLQTELAGLYLQQGRTTEAVEAYRHSLALDSLNAPALNNLAWIYSQLGARLEEALQLSRKSLELEPDNPLYLDTIAEIYFRKRDYYQALTYLRKALDQHPPDSEYYRQKLERFKREAYSRKELMDI